MNIQYLHSIEANQMVMEPVLVLDRLSGHLWLLYVTPSGCLGAIDPWSLNQLNFVVRVPVQLRAILNTREQSNQKCSARLIWST